MPDHACAAAAPDLTRPYRGIMSLELVRGRRHGAAGPERSAVEEPGTRARLVEEPKATQCVWAHEWS